MISLLFVADGAKHFEQAQSVYIKRLARGVSLLTLKPIKHTDRNFIVQEETKRIGQRLQKYTGKVFLCDENGKEATTPSIVKLLQEAKNESTDILFIIGGSYGVDQGLLSEYISFASLRLSGFVLPHSLALLILLEQIYRAEEIQKGSKYHH